MVQPEIGMGNRPGVSRDFGTLEQRRFDAVRLVSQGVPQKEVAKKFNVSRQTVGRWTNKQRLLGDEALKKSARIGRSPELAAKQRELLKNLLSRQPATFWL